MATEDFDFDLAIVGAGPVGLALAGWLARRSSTRALSVALIDARDPALARPAQQRARSDAWRPWRAYAAMHLWNELADRANAARGG